MADPTSTAEAIKKAAEETHNPNTRIDAQIAAAESAPVTAPVVDPAVAAAEAERLAAAKAVDATLAQQQKKAMETQAASITDPNFIVQKQGELTLTSNHPAYPELVKAGVIVPRSGSDVPGSYYKQFEAAGDKAPAAIGQLISNPRDPARARAREMADAIIAKYAQAAQAPATQPAVQ